MTILAAVGEKRDQDKVIGTAYDLATAFEDDLHVLHVIPERDADEHFKAIRSIEEFSDVPYSVERNRAADIAMTFVGRALSDGEADEVKPVGSVGKPDDEILNAAGRLDPRFLVIGGRKRSPVGKAVFGSVTQTVILNANTSVVTVMAES